MNLYHVISSGLIGLLLGAIVTVAICADIHSKVTESYNKEYRRLMDGINRASTALLNVNIRRGTISRDLRELWEGE